MPSKAKNITGAKDEKNQYGTGDVFLKKLEENLRDHLGALILNSKKAGVPPPVNLIEAEKHNTNLTNLKI